MENTKVTAENSNESVENQAMKALTLADLESLQGSRPPVKFKCQYGSCEGDL